MKWREKLILLALLVAMVAIAYLAFNSGPKEAPTSRVTSPAPGQAAAPFPATEQAAAPSPAPAAQAGNQIMPVIIGQTSQGGGLFDAAPSAGQQERPEASSSNEGGPGASGGDKGNSNEREFLRTHGAEFRAYHLNLGRITRPYYLRHPVVRQVSRAFGRLPRYMEVKDQFERDGDPFKFARDAIALPEVRAEISRWLSDPRAWMASLGMIHDTMKDPPPKDIYNAALKFMGTPEVHNYLDEFSQDLNKNSDAMTKAVAQGADISSLIPLIRDIAPNALPAGVQDNRK